MEDAGKNTFVFKVRWPPFVHVDGPQLGVLEDGRLLDRARLGLYASELGGPGRYSQKRRSLYFSSSDNSDPRTNGRAYHYAGRVQLPAGFLAVVALCMGFAAVAWFGRHEVKAAIAKLARRSGLSRLHFVPSMRVSATLLLVCTSLLWLFLLFMAARVDIATDEIGAIVGFCVLLVAIQSLLLILFPGYIALLFSLFAAINAYSLHLCFSGSMMVLPAYVQGLLVLGIGAFHLVLFQILRDVPWMRGWIVGVVLLCVAGVGLIGVTPLVTTGAAPAAAQDFPDIRMATFARRPNVYLLGFDALMPRALTNKLLGIEKPTYLDVISRHGGTIIPNLFADQVPTKWFWATMMNLVPSRNLRLNEIVTGFEPSPVRAIFQHNGYDTYFSFWSGYFGPQKGSFLTSYAYAAPYSTCAFLDPLPRSVGFLGYCTLRENKWLFPAPSREERQARRNEFYLDRLRSITRGDKSKLHLFASHYPRPGHTEVSYRAGAGTFEEFRETYRLRSEEASKMMENMLAEIRSFDPTAIVFLFGDHGSWISRGLDYGDDPAFVVQDRHGIMGAVFGAEACMPYLQPSQGEKMQTTSRLLVGLMQCLAGGASPLIHDYDFGRINQAPDNLRFEDFIYE